MILDPILQLAVYKGDDKLAKAARELVGPGVHQVNATVQILGAISVGEDTETTVKTLNAERLLAASMAFMQANLGEKSPGLGALTSLALELTEGHKAIFKASMKEVIDEGPATKAPRKGSVKMALNYTILETAPVSA